VAAADHRGGHGEYVFRAMQATHQGTKITKVHQGLGEFLFWVVFGRE
jgi:hypothetical protein